MTFIHRFISTGGRLESHNDYLIVIHTDKKNFTKTPEKFIKEDPSSKLLQFPTQASRDDLLIRQLVNRMKADSCEFQDNRVSFDNHTEVDPFEMLALKLVKQGQF